MSSKEVFISYKTSEREAAQWVKEVLEKAGLTCWIAPDCIPGGSDYATQIPKAIRECKVFVLVLSEGAQESRWVPKEVDQAINEDKIILPFMLEDCPLRDNFQFYLSNCQRYNAFENRDTAMAKMLSDIKSIINGGKSFAGDRVINGIPKTQPSRPAGQPYTSPSGGRAATPPPPPAQNFDVYLTVSITPAEASRGCSKMVVINGNGPAAKKLEVKIPAGIKSGTKLRLSGQGKFNPTTGKNGDIYLVVNVFANTANSVVMPNAAVNMNWASMPEQVLGKYAGKVGIGAIISICIGVFFSIITLAVMAESPDVEPVIIFAALSAGLIIGGTKSLKKTNLYKRAAMEELARRRSSFR